MEIKDGDLDGLAIFKRHYSYRPYADGRRNDPLYRNRNLFVGPGGKMVLLTPSGDALFIWRKFINARGDEGLNCAAFRNESFTIASKLILEAENMALQRWKNERRFYTYVNPEKVKGSCPGYCFIRAGWKRCGVTKGGLIVLEKICTSTP